MNPLTHPVLRANRGFTLVEIMVALALGLLLMLGVGKLFVGNSEGYRLQSGMARLQENARFALDILKRDVGQAGYPRNFFVGIPIQGIDGGGTASDAITVTYQSAADCLGGPVAAAPNTVNNYTALDHDGDGISSLVCNGQALVDGIDNMQVLYGLDTDPTPDRVANSYVFAVPAASWSRVVSVRIALLVNTIDNVAPAADADTYALLNAPPVGPMNDLRRRQVFTSTILIRN